MSTPTGTDEGQAPMSELGEMTDSERAVNEAAKFYPMRHNARGPETVSTHPCIEVGGTQVYAYVRDGALVVSVDLETADHEVFRIYGEDDCVPVQVRVMGTAVFEAGV